MCGIIGYAGSGKVGDILISGLERLEYRGYDSAGMALYDNGKISIVKEKGKVEKLKNKYAQSPFKGSCGVGHTRWATHGKADIVNCHPHTNASSTISVVHNGIIENHEELRSFLQDKGYAFASETDTETVPHLIDYYYHQNGDFLKAVTECANKLKGSYALGIISTLFPRKIVGVCHKSPLIVCAGDGGNFVCSDINAVSGSAEKVCFMEDGEVVVVGDEDIHFLNLKGEVVEKSFTPSQGGLDGHHKGGYAHFMLKEIYQQPHIIHKIISENVSAGGKTQFASMDVKMVCGVDKIFIVGCGTAYHAALVGKQIIEKYAKVPVEVCPSSEFRYGNPMINENTLVVGITQSGETADTISAIVLAKERGCGVAVITNTPRSRATAVADYVFLTSAGAEIAVASTKAYSAQLAALYIFALFLAENKDGGQRDIDSLKDALLKLPKCITEALKAESAMKKLAGKLSRKEHIYYIGRGAEGITAREGALKMKEITYIHAEAYPAGELKHGPMALIEEGTTVIAIDTYDSLHDKMMTAVSEVESRGAEVYRVSPFVAGDGTITVPETHSDVMPFVSIVPLQLLAYHTALEKGYDADKPRNLAKSVTVE